jgi:Kef-type K+ transport system membrane component KefB
MARELQLFNELAVVLIAFIAGLEINVARLRPRLLGMVRVGGTNILVTNVGFFVVFWLAWPWLPILPEATASSAFRSRCSRPSSSAARRRRSRWR